MLQEVDGSSLRGSSRTGRFGRSQEKSGIETGSIQSDCYEPDSKLYLLRIVTVETDGIRCGTTVRETVYLNQGLKVSDESELFRIDVRKLTRMIIRFIRKGF
jgi:hypothetical protein